MPEWILTNQIILQIDDVFVSSLPRFDEGAKAEIPGPIWLFELAHLFHVGNLLSLGELYR